MPKQEVGSYFDGLTKFLHEAHEMAVAIGPGWGIMFLLVILLFLPHIGVVPHLAKLLKEDRVDARKQKVDMERLTQKFRNRPQKNLQAQQRKLPPRS